jgi:hypothetical protein
MRFLNPEPVSGGTDGELVWWHIPVSLKYRWLKPFPLNDVSCTLLVGDNTETELCFRPLQGMQPEYRINLHWGDVRHIPICARPVTDNFLLGFTAPYILLHGQIAENWALRQGIARITDSNHYFTFDNSLNLVGPKTFSITLQITRGRQRYTEKRYLLSVPSPDADNDSFTLSQAK